MTYVYNSQLDAYSLYHQQQENSSTSLGGPALPALGHALAGSTGTAIANLCIYPLDLITTRLQVQRQLRKTSNTASDGEYKGVIDAATQIYAREGGIRGFYGGVIQDTGKSIADSFLFFLFYNYLRQNRLQRNGPNATTLPALDELYVGAFAGACSKFFTTPIANIVTRKQTASMVAARSGSLNMAEPSVEEIVKQIRSEKGWQGFWSGYSASLVLTLNPSITFFLYETFKRTLLPRSKRDDPGARITFLMAAISKAIASTITYPFSLAKARAQVSGKPPVNQETATEIKDQIKSASNTEESKKVGESIRNKAAHSTVFAAVLRIYREEGAGGLYEGVWGDMLKGFFSHGITMIVKEAVHKVIIQAYLLILRALKKLPSPAEVASEANQVVQDGLGKAQESVSGVVDSVNGTVGTAVDSAKQQLGLAYERAQTMGSNASEVVGNASDAGRRQVGGLLGNAQEQLGKNLEEVGQTIRPGSGTGKDSD